MKCLLEFQIGKAKKEDGGYDIPEVRKCRGFADTAMEGGREARRSDRSAGRCGAIGECEEEGERDLLLWK